MSKNKLVQKRPTVSGERIPGRLGYFLSRALLNLRQNTMVNVLTIGTITMALLILSLFLLVFINVEGLAETWSEKVQVTAYFERELAPPDQETLKKGIAGLKGTDRVAYVGKGEAMARFRERLKGQEALLEGVPPDVLPASFEIRLKKGYRESAAVEGYVAQLKKLPGITEVQYGEEWVKRFTAFMTFLRLVGLVLGGFIAGTVIFIVSNTIKLTVYARQDELEVLSLVGATRFFIKAPFMLEGMIQGGVGGLLAVILLYAGYVLFMHNAGNFLSFNPATAGLAFLTPLHLCGVVSAGLFLGLFGSLGSLRRFVKI